MVGLSRSVAGLGSGPFMTLRIRNPFFSDPGFRTRIRLYDIIYKKLLNFYKITIPVPVLNIPLCKNFSLFRLDENYWEQYRKIVTPFHIYTRIRIRDPRSGKIISRIRDPKSFRIRNTESQCRLQNCVSGRLYKVRHRNTKNKILIWMPVKVPVPVVKLKFWNQNFNTNRKKIWTRQLPIIEPKACLMWQIYDFFFKKLNKPHRL
jgi:hypothetical protein